MSRALPDAPEGRLPAGSVGWVVKTAKELTLESTLLPRGRPRQQRYYAGMEFPQCRMGFSLKFYHKKLSKASKKFPGQLGCLQSELRS